MLREVLELWYDDAATAHIEDRIVISPELLAEIQELSTMSRDAEELLEAGYHVSGALLENESTKYIAHIENKLNLVNLDILDLGSCQAMLQKQPTHRDQHSNCRSTQIVS